VRSVVNNDAMFNWNTMVISVIKDWTLSVLVFCQEFSMISSCTYQVYMYISAFVQINILD